MRAHAHTHTPTHPPFMALNYRLLLFLLQPSPPIAFQVQPQQQQPVAFQLFLGDYMQHGYAWYRCEARYVLHVTLPSRNLNMTYAARNTYDVTSSTWRTTHNT